MKIADTAKNRFRSYFLYFVLCDRPGESSSEKNCCTLTRTITQYELLILLGSNHLLCYFLY